jgi:hypothetical protein
MKVPHCCVLCICLETETLWEQSVEEDSLDVKELVS